MSDEAVVSEADDRFVHVRGASENNLRTIDVDIPRNALVAFTGISGSGKSSLAFGTIYAEAQRRYFESVAPYARRLLAQVGAPRVHQITGLPPAVALRQRGGSPSSRSTVGTITTLSNLLRLLFSRAGEYPEGAEHLEAESFSPNTVSGACPSCQGLGWAHDVVENLMVPDDSLSIRDGAIAAWPGAWQGANLRSIVRGLGIDVDRPWRKLPKSERDWLLYTDEQPSVFIEPEPGRIDHGYHGKFWSARKHVMHVLTNSASERMRTRAISFTRSVTCHDCSGTGLTPEALAVRFAGRSIAEINAMTFTDIVELLRPITPQTTSSHDDVASTICADLLARIDVLIELGLGYLGPGRSSTTLSPGEAQRLRVATQLRSGLFGVVYVLDEPSAGLHPVDAEPLLNVLERLKTSGNSIFVVEHDLDIVCRADWIVDIGPAAGEGGGCVLYSGPVEGLRGIEGSVTGRYLFDDERPPTREVRTERGVVQLRGITRHNLREVSVDIPLHVLTVVTGVSGSGKSTLISQVLADAVRRHLGGTPDPEDGYTVDGQPAAVSGLDSIDRLVRVDQRPIGRTPRSTLATYTGMFDAVRRLFAATDAARERGYTASRFSFNVAEGRCPTCRGEGFVSVELMFLPGTYGPCPTCDGARYNPDTLEVTYRGRTIADVLAMTVDAAAEFFGDVKGPSLSLETLRNVGLGYLRLGQPATELSGGEAQRIKLATELQRVARGHTLYLLDEPTSGLHPADVDLLLDQLHLLVDAGNTVIVVEHDLPTIARSDWVIDLGPGGGDDGGQVIASGTPLEVASASASVTGPFLAAYLGRG